MTKIKLTITETEAVFFMRCHTCYWVSFYSRETLAKSWWSGQILAENKHETMAGGYLTFPLR